MATKCTKKMELHSHGRYSLTRRDGYTVAAAHSLVSAYSNTLFMINDVTFKLHLTSYTAVQAHAHIIASVCVCARVV